MFKRVLISVFNNRVRTIIFGVILLLIATLVLTSVSIKSATEKSMIQARRELEPQVTINLNFDKIIEELLEEGLTYEEIKGNWSEYATPVTNDLVEELAASEYVRDYNYTINNYSVANSFSGLDSSGNIIEDGLSYMNIIGTYNAGLLNEFNGSYTLADGELFGGKDSNVAIISKMLADANGLSVGDSIVIEKFETIYIWEHDTEDDIEAAMDDEGNIVFPEDATVTEGWTLKESITRAVEGTGYPLEIIGLFETNDVYMDYSILNQIYVPLNEVIAFEGYSEEETYEVNRVTLFIDDPDNIEKFYADVNDVELIKDGTFLLSDNNEAYEAMAQPLSEVGNFIDLILLIIVIASVAIITLLTGNSLKDRKYEIGVLLSLGEKKIKVALQYVFEMLLIGSIAFTLAIASSNAVASDIGDKLLENQIKSSEVKDDPYGKDTGKAGGKDYGKGGGKDDVKVDYVNELDVRVTSREILIMYGIGSGVIILSSILPSLYISRYQPKKILSSRN